MVLKKWLLTMYHQYLYVSFSGLYSARTLISLDTHLQNTFLSNEWSDRQECDNWFSLSFLVCNCFITAMRHFFVASVRDDRWINRNCSGVCKAPRWRSGMKSYDILTGRNNASVIFWFCHSFQEIQTRYLGSTLYNLIFN